MFSRLLNSAKHLISKTPTIEPTTTSTITASASATTLILDETMVRTRRSGENAKPPVVESSEEEGDTITVNTASVNQHSKSKKRRVDDDIGEHDFEPVPKRKRKSLPVRAKDEVTPKSNTKAVVQITLIEPPSQLSLGQSTRPGTVEDSEAESEELEDEVDEHNDEDLGASQPSQFAGVTEVPSSDPRDIKSEDEFLDQEHPRANVEEETEEGAEEAEDELDVEKEPEEATSKPAHKHKRFDSAEPEELEPFSTAREIIEIPSDHSSSDDESDDEAPEAVTTQAAAKTARLKEQEAANAVKEQLTATRLKRQSREAALKKQADKKRRKEAKALARAARAEEAATPNDPEDAQSPPEPKLNPATPLPNHLPLSYLSDTDSDAFSLPNETPERPRSKKTKFADLTAEKKVKDKRVGRTTYRVEKRSATGLAPKASYGARRMKEAWMLGGERKGTGQKSEKKGKTAKESKFGMGERRVASKGFLKR